MNSTAQLVVVVATVTTALGVLVRQLKLAQLLTETRTFLRDWLGTPDRDGVSGVPSFPARMAAVEHGAEQLREQLRDTLDARLTALAFTVDATHQAAVSNAERMAVLDARVTDHRRRNDEQVGLLREAVAELRAAQLVEVEHHRHDRTDAQASRED